MVSVQDERDRLIAELRAENATLRARIEDLERLLRQNSSNSNRPPSGDAPADREARQKKPPTGRKRGGQRGHKGWKRKLLPAEQVNRTRDCFPKSCRRCDLQLPRKEDVDPFRHQVVEVPPITPDVTEYRLHSVACECGRITRAALPEGVPQGMCGPRLMAMIGLVTGVYKVSRREAVRLFSDMVGVEISLGALSGAEEDVSHSIITPVEEARQRVSEQPVKHVDATGWRQAGCARTLWTIATMTLTVFAITTDATRANLRGLFTAVRGILVTDRGTQFGFWAMQHRQICWAHLIRKFAAFAERPGPTGQLGYHLLLWSQTMIHHWHQVRDGTMSRRDFQKSIAWLQPIIEGLLARGVQMRVRGVSGSCADILDHRLALWTFATHTGVDPTNNHAERELRAFVLWRKKSFGAQSERGNQFAARIMTVAHSLRKQHRHVLSFLTDACQAALVGKPAPSLLPALARA